MGVGKDFTYAILLDGAIVGACGLLRREDTEENGREIGYWLHPAATGPGIATRTARALAEPAFRLQAWTSSRSCTTRPTTPAAVPARLGFTEYRRSPAEAVTPAETGEEQIWRLNRA
ncbi:GNAT family N-acetyltransferase [Kitasatospora sp. NPDC056531]|uniref:GNAT family N-acetyltransferase n=1 Tax=Kitasatospora sp. NPDC056531 TaxID=3345856 RepID=UPI0036A1CB63